MLKIKASIFNYLIPIYLSIFGYENLFHYNFGISLPVSLLKLLILVYFTLLVHYIIKNDIKLKFTLTELSFFIAILLFFIFSYINLSLGIGYSLSMFFFFTTIYLMKYIKNELNFNKIINRTLYINLFLIIVNLFLSFMPNFYTYKYQFFGTHGNPNIYGMWILFILVLVYLYEGNKKFRTILFLLIMYLTVISISRSTIVASSFIILLFYWNNKKYLYVLIGITVISFLYLNNEFKLFSAIITRFSGDSARDFDSMLFLIINNDYLPNGTNTFSEYMRMIGSIPDNSYFALISDLSYFSLFYFLPFILIFVFSDIKTKLFIFPLLFQSFFEKVIISPTNSYLFIVIMIIMVFPEKLKIYKPIWRKKLEN